MKRFVLLACLLPCMGFAQSVSNPVTRLSKIFRQVPEQSVQLRAATAVLDSVYTFQGKENYLSEISNFTYNEEGNKQEKTVKSVYGNGEGFRVTSKTEYKTYPDVKTNSTINEELIYVDPDQNGKWVPSYKSLTWINTKGVPFREETYMYRDGEWLKDNFTVTLEMKDDLPTAMIDSTWEGQAEASVMRMEATYEKGQKYPSSGLFLAWDAEAKAWIPVQRATLAYDSKGNLLHQYSEEYEDGKWKYSFDYTYTYDERGNMIYSDEVEDSYGTAFYTRYQNFYSDEVVTHNEQLATEVSPVQIRFVPSSKILSIDLNEVENATLTIVSTHGVVVRNQILSQSLTTIPVDNLPKGYYIIHIRTSKHAISKTLIFS